MTNLDLDRWKPFTRKLPYGLVKNGYLVNPDDPLELIPDVEQIKWLEEGFNYLEGGSSLREVAEWLGQKLKKSITHQTVGNLYKTHRKPWVRTKTNKRKGTPRTKESIRLAGAKSAAARALKKANELEKKRRLKVLKPEDYDVPPVPKEKPTPNVFKDAPASVNIVFQPNPGPQTLFLSASEQEVLYGGAAGGNPKSWILASFSK